MFDPELFGQAMGEAIRKAVEPLHAEIASLKKQLAASPDVSALVAQEVTKAAAAIRVPTDGKDCDLAVVRDMVAEAVAAQPKAEKGADGKSVTLEDLRPLLDSAVEAIRKEADEAIAEPLRLADAARDSLQKAVGDLRQPADGRSITLDDVQPILSEAVKNMQESATKVLDAAIKAIPAPINGKDGIDGKDGAMGERGEKGADGIGLAGAMLDREGALLVTLTNGEVKSLGVVVGKDGSHGANGKDGLDGISLDAFEMDYLEETHEVRVKASCAGRTKELRYPAGGLRPAGYWREGAKAKACETWVHDGSLWIAVKDTPSKPQTGSDDWIIAARKGRDGESIVKTVNAGPAAPIKLGGAK